MKLIQSSFAIYFVFLAALTLAGCGDFTYDIDSTVKPSSPTLPGFNGGEARPVGVMVGPDSIREEFPVNEVVFWPKDQDDLNAFLAEYDGSILRDGMPPTPPGISPAEDAQSSGRYLIRVNPEHSNLGDLEANMIAAGIEGRAVFSSLDAARLAAIVVREKVRQRRVSPNLIMYNSTVLEHPDGSGGYLDAEEWWYMKEDAFSVGVTHAWEYLRYMNIPPIPPPGGSVTWDPPVVAIVDRGFALDETTGVPLDGNSDYFYYGSEGPIQYDFFDWDSRAGGESPGGGWHGTGAFGVCCARPRNKFGSAGTGGPVAIPALLKVHSTWHGGWYSVADAIRFAAIWWAPDVITISLHQELGPLGDVGGVRDSMQNAVYTATSFGAVVVAAAGNDGDDISDRDIIPAKLDAVICVSSINSAGHNPHNYGSGVDICAPTGVYSTVNPDTIGGTGMSALKRFTGTSAATPFVAGVIALMRALDPSLTWNQVRDILQATANDSDDPKVTHGYIDAYKAVAAVRPNEPPTVKIVKPLDGASVSYGSARLSAEVTDPDPGARAENVVVIYSSDSPDEAPCTAVPTFTDEKLSMNCAKRFSVLGYHDITATATDPHGGVANDTITINVINTPPTVQIVKPDDGSTFFAHQSIDLGAYISDPEELPFPSSLVSWTSDRDGILGDGWSITKILSEGFHTITASAEDEKGDSGHDTITVNVVSSAGIPEATILEPGDGEHFTPGTMIVFQATGTDPEDGPLPDSSFAWSSDIDGSLGMGKTISAVLSGPTSGTEFRRHTITLTVTDSDANEITYTIEVHIGGIL